MADTFSVYLQQLLNIRGTECANNLECDVDVGKHQYSFLVGGPCQPCCKKGSVVYCNISWLAPADPWERIDLLISAHTGSEVLEVCDYSLSTRTITKLTARGGGSTLGYSSCRVVVSILVESAFQTKGHQ